MNTGYCIQEPNGKTLRINTTRYLRKDCVKDFLFRQFKTDWKDWYRYGWRVVKVNIIPTELMVTFKATSKVKAYAA